MGLRDLFRREPEDLTTELMREADADRGAPDPSPGWSDAPADALTDRVRADLAAGKKLQAIKTYREATGVGLKEAKEAVEALESGGSLPVGPAAASAVPKTEAEVRVLIEQNRLIDAIKLYREIHGVGLKEAKDAVDAIRDAGPSSDAGQAGASGA
jgi:ribosomal protein L7/L12